MKQQNSVLLVNSVLWEIFPTCHMLSTNILICDTDDLMKKKLTSLGTLNFGLLRGTLIEKNRL